MIEKIWSFVESMAYKEGESKRMNRRQFFMTLLWVVLFAIFANSMVLKLLWNNPSEIAYTIANIVLLFIALWIYWAAMGTAVLRRAHDMNRKWWKEVSIFLIIYTIFAIFQYGTVILTDVWLIDMWITDSKPIVLGVLLIGMFVYYLYLIFAPGSKGENDYGPEAPDTWIIKDDKTSIK